MSKSKQEVVVEMVQAGTYTRAEIKEGAQCTSGALASYLSGMRNAAKFTGSEICPIEVDVDGKKVFQVTTFAKAEAIKAERVASNSSSTSAKTPAERLDAAEKRVTRVSNKLEKAEERAEANEDSRELQLRWDLAKIEVELADIELEKAKALVADQPILEEDEADTEVESEDELM